MSRLEKFIIERKGEFDSLDPRPESWNKIEKVLGNGGRKEFGWVWKAAAVILFGVSVFLLIDRANRTGEELNQQLVEFSATEQYFENIIVQTSGMIESFTHIDKELEEEFKKDVDDLGEQYEQLKAEYQNNHQPQIRDALINNLQLRIALLNNQLMILKDIENLSENHEIHI